MEDQENNSNVVNITIDTEDGPIEERLDLDSLSLEEVAELVVVVPTLRNYYGQRLIKELKD
jgi:membrane protein YdbS with pleckstrin-like domain